MAGQRIAGTFRRVTRRGERAARYAASETGGVARRVAHPRSAQEPPPDDVTLARKVETELFRPPDVPKGKINVSAVGGVVELRGEAQTGEQVKELEEKTRRIPGVSDVRNLLHLAGTPSPTA